MKKIDWISAALLVFVALVNVFLAGYNVGLRVEKERLEQVSPAPEARP